MIVEPEEGKTLNFIEQIIEEEIAAGKNGGKVHTRFPPERPPDRRSGACRPSRDRTGRTPKAHSRARHTPSFWP